MEHQINNEAFYRIINTPARGLGAASVGGLAAYAQERKLAVYPALIEALKDDRKPSFLSNANKKKFENFVNIIMALTQVSIYMKRC